MGRSKNNPSKRAWWIAGGATALTAAAVTVAVVVSEKPKKKKKAGAGEAPSRGEVPIPTPDELPGPEGEPAPVPTGELPSTEATPTPEGLVCEMGEKYPGYVPQITGLAVGTGAQSGRCVPGPTTPPGIYVHSDCTEFDFVAGEASPQIVMMDEMVQSAARSGKSIDPTLLVTQFLQYFWPECQWPPAPEASPRVVQLYMALSFAVGHQILIGALEVTSKRKRGRVLGKSDESEADEAIAERLGALGLWEFNPSVVPEIVIPEVPAPPGELAGPGGVVGPGEVPKPGQAPPKPPCAENEKTSEGDVVVSSALFDERRSKEIILLVRAPGEKCTEYEIEFGICVLTRSSATYGLLDLAVAGWPQVPTGEMTPFGPETKPSFPEGFEGFGLDDGFGSPNVAQFKLPHIWKRVLRVKVTYPGPTVGAVMVGDPAMDPCPDKAQFWPKTPGIGHFRVLGVDLDWRKWEPEPKIIVEPAGNIVKAKVYYSGLPVFVHVQGQATGNKGVALLTEKTSYRIFSKVKSIGSV